MKKNIAKTICFLLVGLLFISCSINVTPRHPHDPYNFNPNGDTDNGVVDHYEIDDDEFVDDYHDLTGEKKIAKLSNGTNEIKIPEGKNLYTLVINMPSNYSENGYGDIVMQGSDFKGDSKSLIPSPYSGNLIDLQTTRSDVYFAHSAGAYDVSKYKGTVSYLGMSEENKVLYYIEQNALAKSESKLNFTSKDGKHCSIYVDYKNVFLPKLNELLNEVPLEDERNYFGLSEFDVDETGYFHVIFNDFGSDSAKYAGKFGASGTIGMYINGHIRTSFQESNKADMFFVNTKYLDIVIKKFTEYMASNYTEEQLSNLDKPITSPLDYFYDLAAGEIRNTLFHEYMHYLMDSNIYKENGSGLLASGFPIFWVEGMAESAAYVFAGKEDHSGFLTEWFNHAHEYQPKLGQTEESCMSYLVAPMFFLYVKERFGEDTYKSLAQYTYNTAKDLNTIVYDCTGHSFGELYKDFILRLFTPLTESTKYGSKLSFAEDWDITKESLQKRSVPIKWNVKGTGDGGIINGGMLLLKWENNPETIKLNSDCEVYALYL